MNKMLFYLRGDSIMKKCLKFISIIIISFISTFYNKDGLNIIFTIPLLAFFMYNGLYCFITSLMSLLIGFICKALIYYDSFSFVFFLIGISIFFLIYYILLFFNKKTIINYFTSCIISIISTYLIYYICYESFIIKNFINILFLTSIITLLFAFIIKNFSFYLLIFKDEYSKILLTSLMCIYLYNLNNFLNYEICEYIYLFSILLVSSIFAIKSKTLNVLAFNSAFLLLNYLFNKNIYFNYTILTLLISTLLSINKSKYKFLNSLFTLTCFVLFYLINSPGNFYYYIIVSVSITVILLFVNSKNEATYEKKYYKQYVQNKNEMLLQLQTFQSLFVTLADNFKKATQNRILQRSKEEVFNKLCYNCPEVENCHKKGKHLLLNYIKESLNDNLDENKIRYIKQNCVKQETYFKLLDNFTNTYLLKNFKQEEQTKTKNIIASNFYSFAEIMEKCCNTFINDRLIIAKNFYKNLNEILNQYKFDIVFLNDLSNENHYSFDIAIKNIKKEEINSILLPIINETLQTQMEIINIDVTTMTFNYFIISIKEKEKINISYAIKQSNEDIKANGDSYCYFNTLNNFYLAISDGMGNGLDANEESKFTLDLLTSMIKTKMDIKSSIALINELIQLKNDFESYTTLDLISIDKQTNISTFYKLGAFNAYIVRNHNVVEVNNFSLPLGIVDEIIIHPSSYKLEKGDIIIMCSDGMIDDTNNDIIDILENISFDSPKVICNTLFTHLIDIRQNSDDATLVVITIE